MATKPHQYVGLMIRDVLQEEQPISITDVREEVNIQRKEKGLRRIGYPTMKRYFKQAVNLGMLEVVDTEGRVDAGKGGILEEAQKRNLYSIVMGYELDDRWEHLPSIVAGLRTR